MSTTKRISTIWTALWDKSVKFERSDTADTDQHLVGMAQGYARVINIGFTLNNIAELETL